jgi:hypothetical protein
MDRIRVINMTTFFNRELFMYSLGDIKFKKPIALKKVAYVTVFLILWGIPWYLTMGPPTGPVQALWQLGVPLFAGHYASKPIFGGKGLVDFLKTLFGYIAEPKGWTDLNSNNDLDETTYVVNQEIWIGRRQDLYKLHHLKLNGIK